MSDWNKTIQAMNKIDELYDEIERLRAIEDRYKVLVDDHATLHKEAAVLRARLAEAEAVIKPFATLAHFEGDCGVADEGENTAIVQSDYFKAAARWMEKKP